MWLHHFRTETLTNGALHLGTTTIATISNGNKMSFDGEQLANVAPEDDEINSVLWVGNLGKKRFFFFITCINEFPLPSSYIQLMSILHLQCVHNQQFSYNHFEKFLQTSKSRRLCCMSSSLRLVLRPEVWNYLV